MAFFANRDINRLAVHAALVALAWSLAGLFFTVFLLQAGLSPAQIFLASAAMLAMRFALRPLVTVAVARFGLRRVFTLGTLMSALQFPAIALVHGIDWALLVFCATAALAQVFYWTCYHVYFSALGDVDHRGKQIGARQALGAIAGIVGPAAGGLLLNGAGPWFAFGAAFVIQIAAIVPLLKVEEPKIAFPPPRGAFKAAATGIRLFFADGWIQAGSATAWSIVMFQTLDARYDSFGGVLAAAALVGALGGMALGRVMDMGHARRSVWINAAILALGLILKSIGGGHPLAVIAIAIGTTLFSGLYTPYWMTAVYNAAKTAPCTFRYHFACEGAWDAGGVCASLAAAAVCAAALPIEVVILLALPLVAAQAWILDASYGAHDRAQRASRFSPAPEKSRSANWRSSAFGR